VKPVHKILLLLAVTLLTSCATTAKYESSLNSWMGQPEQDLVRAWGAPARVYESGETKYLTYSNSRNVYLAGTAPTYNTNCNDGYCTTTPSGGTPAQNINLSCETIFEVVDSDVTSWSYKGNGCKSK
jgi:hypothetical protein